MPRLAAIWMLFTQGALMGTQLLLLPIQVRLWGMEGTAQWNAALALATLLHAADLGLKAFGHSSIGPRAAAGAGHEAESFPSVWAVLRLLVAGFAMLALAATWVFHREGSVPAWLCWLVVACSAECLLNSRVTYMDSLGLMALAEGCYALILCSRLAAATVGLLAFRASPEALAIIYAASAVGGLAVQSLALRSHPELGLAAGGFRAIEPRTFALLKYAVGYPIAAWCRLSLPVLVLSAAAPAAMVNAYVALRAVFGFARVAVQQASRHASVQYARASALPDGRAGPQLQFWCIVCVILGTAFALGVVLDGGVLLSKWVPGTSSKGYGWVALTFALAAPFFANQLMLMVAMRTGREARAAGLQVLYAGLAVAAAAVGLLSASMPVYLSSWLLCELAFSGMVLAATREQGLARTYVGWTAVGVLAVLGCFLALRWVPGFRGAQLHDLAVRAAVYLLLLALMSIALGRSLRLPAWKWAARTGHSRGRRGSIRHRLGRAPDGERGPAAPVLAGAPAGGAAAGPAEVQSGRYLDEDGIVVIGVPRGRP
ncbi:hypothetical protein [Ramlibacter sp.]|uniref:hypothetical protein n=1 Tax=Ramlibacter sp. TaxID=1917967 RepID=UPI002FCC974B